MKKRIFLAALVFSTLLTSQAFAGNWTNPDPYANSSYNRNEAKTYVELFTDPPNTLYFDYADVGGDCTNFASQVLFHGNLPEKGGLEKQITETLEKAQLDDQNEEDSHSLFPESVDEVIKDRQVRLQKIKAALQQLEARKPEDESKIPEKDQINFTDTDSRIMDTKTQGVIQAYNPQIAVDGDRAEFHSRTHRQIAGEGQRGCRLFQRGQYPICGIRQG